MPSAHDKIDSHGFRANVGIVLMQPDGRVFLGHRVGGNGWQFPQGGVLEGESLEQAMYRELHEEIGLQPQHVQVLGITKRWLCYRLPERYLRREQVPLCVGQKQRWYLLMSHNGQPEFRFDMTPAPEFAGWRWSNFWEPVREVVYFKRRIYNRALHELGHLAVPGGLPAYPEWWPTLIQH